MSFTHLHTHSDASKDGVRDVSQLVTFAKRSGFDALAITDHGSLANAVSFSIAATQMGIKPIIGLEAYVDFDGQTGHLTLLGNGRAGLENLIRLNNIGHAKHQKTPSFSIDDLLNDCDHLVCLSGCVSSPFQRLGFSDAVGLMSKFKRAFKSRFFIEMMFVSDTDTWTRPMKLAERGNVPLVITNDVHFPLKDDANIHKLVTTMRAGYSYNSGELWLKTMDDIWASARGKVSDGIFFDAVTKSSFISGKIKPIIFDSEPTLPHIEGARDKLRKLVDDGRVDFSGAAKKRLNYELNVIDKMGYSSYFVILQDIIDNAKRLGAYVGPGRGSGAGSLVLYSIGVTDIDPLKYDLPFERFLNPERKGMPDVDVDIDSAHRDIVIDYVAKRWKGIPIGTVIRYSHKTAVHDLAKVLKVPRDLETEAADGGYDSKAMMRILDEYPEFEAAYDAILGQIRHRGRHAAGIVITDRTVPIERASGNLVASWAEGKYNEMSKAGIVKYDLLGLEALTILQRLERSDSDKADASKEHKDDDPAFELFRKGDLSGIFQFSGSAGIRELTMKLQPRKFDDLIALNALYRPGTLDAGTADRFVEWRHKPRKLHPLVDDILSPTYGVIVYQEQVMAVFSRIMGGSLGESDVARRIIVKSKKDDPVWVEKFTKLEATFMKGALSKGIAAKIATQIWDEIATHARYSFNKAHSTAYAQIAWQMAWWKYYFPQEFYASIMSSDRDNMQQYIFEAIGRGYEIKMPSINNIGDDNEFYVDEGKIVVPANIIKYVTNVSPIRKAMKDGPFTSYEDFMERISKSEIRGQARAALYAIGAFSGLKGSPSSLGISPKMKALIDEAKSSDDPQKRTQIAFLGFFIPSIDEIDEIESEKKRGMVAGIVANIKKKKSGFGPYTVFYLNPTGVFWTRGLKIDSIEVGDIVSAKVSPSSGKATSIRRIS